MTFSVNMNFTLINRLTSKILSKTLSRNIHRTDDLKSLKSWYKSVVRPKITTPPYDHIVQIGDPVLRQVASPVPVDKITSNEVQNLIENLITVMRSHKSVGLAAPQIGVPLQIILMEFTEKMSKEFSPEIYKIRQMEPIPLTIFINPKMKIKNYNIRTFNESCESVRGYCAEVSRYDEVFIEWIDRTGQHQEAVFKGWNGRIIQHELDHLNGKLYTDIMDRKTLSCCCWEAVNRHGGRVEIRFCP